MKVSPIIDLDEAYSYTIYDASALVTTSFTGGFEDALVPAGTHFVQIQTFSEELGGGDVDAHTSSLSTTVVPTP